MNNTKQRCDTVYARVNSVYLEYEQMEVELRQLIILFDELAKDPSLASDVNWKRLSEEISRLKAFEKVEEK